MASIDSSPTKQLLRINCGQTETDGECFIDLNGEFRHDAPQPLDEPPLIERADLVE